MRCIPLAALLIALPAGAAPVPKHLMKDEPFWPTEVGTKWVYERNGKESVHVITKAEKIAGGTRLTIKIDDTGELAVYDVGSSGVIHRSACGQQIDGLILRLPSKPEDTWIISPPEGTKRPHARVTVGETEEIRVPAGTFRAIKVTIAQITADGKAFEDQPPSTHWFAPGVGSIKIDDIRALKSFTPGKK